MKLKIDILNILLYNQSIGTLLRMQDDKNIFAFDEDYLNNTNRPTLSLSYKDILGELTTNFKSTQTRIPPFFANLLPEGHLREYLAKRANVKPQREFFLLWALGQDLPGAVSILPENEDSHMYRETKILSDSQKGDDNKITMRFSLAGVQLKFSAIKEATGGLTIPANGVGGSWIIKLPSSKFNGVPENEYAMMELARSIGIDVPETKLISINQISGLPDNIEAFGDYVFAIKRFDRMDNGDRIHIEDFAQIFGVYPENKYMSGNYRKIAEVIWIETGEKGITEFIRRLIFNVLIGNADMHLKNWSLIYPDRINAKLAPAYDFMSTLPYMPDDKLALNFMKSKAFDTVNIDQIKRFAAKVYLPEKIIVETVLESVELFNEVWHSENDLPIDKKTKKVINEHLKMLPLWKST